MSCYNQEQQAEIIRLVRTNSRDKSAGQWTPEHKARLIRNLDGLWRLWESEPERTFQIERPLNADDKSHAGKALRALEKAASELRALSPDGLDAMAQQALYGHLREIARDEWPADHAGNVAKAQELVAGADYLASLARGALSISSSKGGRPREEKQRRIVQSLATVWHQFTGKPMGFLVNGNGENGKPLRPGEFIKLVAPYLFDDGGDDNKTRGTLRTLQHYLK